MNGNPSSAQVIRLCKVDAAYGVKTVLHGVSLSVGRGELVAVTGPNGSGKSTLLKIISGMLAATGGTVSVLGRSMDNPTDRQRVQRNIGYLSQVQNDPEIAVSVVESVLLGLWGTRFSWLKRPTDEDRREAMKRLELVGMEKLAHRDIRTLSGGQRQRMALARALVRDPELLLMDEPTTYLDAQAKDDLMRSIGCLHDALGFTTLLVSHEAISGRVFDRTLRIENGVLAEAETGR